MNRIYPSLSRPRHLAVSLLLATCIFRPMISAQAQPDGYNYDESKVPSYTLEDPLQLANGKKVSNSSDWTKLRRPEIMELFQTQVYGHGVPRPTDMTFKVLSHDPKALDGKAIRRQVAVYFTGKEDGPHMEILIYIPSQASQPVPAFLGLNFFGNHTIHADPGIHLSPRWMRNASDKGVVNNRATEASRGTSASRWDVDSILARGYALATIYCGDLEPDHANGWKDGVRQVFTPATASRPPASPSPGAPPTAAPDHWGAIGAWSWGLSRAVDYFETDPAIDAGKIALLGHSRLGKTSLWAGAQDQRFAIVISNNSGCGGAALSKRRFGETVQRINTSFPHWFCGNFKQYNDQEDNLPLDQHMLMALMAPRPLYVASAEKDLWADPHGEFLSAYHAQPVYALFGKQGLPTPSMPNLNQPVGQTVRYHIRTGKHDVTDYDWAQYLSFADQHLK